MRVAAIGLGFVAVLLGASAALAAGGGSGGGGSFNMPSAPARESTPEEQAKTAYNHGVRAVKQADKHAKAAEEASDEKKSKALGKAKKQYENARDHFATALRSKPDMYEAWNYVGYTSRKLGEYEKALAAYDEALRLNPSYAEAIEYRGEAYLGLNRLEDAKSAYMQLFREARPLADQLMAAMQRWVSERRAAGTAAAEVDALAQWLDERANVARQTASLATDAVAPRWN